MRKIIFILSLIWMTNSQAATLTLYNATSQVIHVDYSLADFPHPPKEINTVVLDPWSYKDLYIAVPHGMVEAFDMTKVWSDSGASAQDLCGVNFESEDSVSAFHFHATNPKEIFCSDE